MRRPIDLLRTSFGPLVVEMPLERLMGDTLFAPFFIKLKGRYAKCANHPSNQSHSPLILLSVLNMSTTTYQ